jgi:hypothetical protein
VQTNSREKRYSVKAHKGEHYEKEPSAVSNALVVADSLPAVQLFCAVVQPRHDGNGQVHTESLRTLAAGVLLT